MSSARSRRAGPRVALVVVMLLAPALVAWLDPEPAHRAGRRWRWRRRLRLHAARWLRGDAR